MGTVGEIIAPLERLLIHLSGERRRWIRRDDVLVALGRLTMGRVHAEVVDRALRVLVRRGLLSMRITDEAALLFAYDPPESDQPRLGRLVHP